MDRDDQSATAVVGDCSDFHAAAICGPEGSERAADLCKAEMSINMRMAIYGIKLSAYTVNVSAFVLSQLHMYCIRFESTSDASAHTTHTHTNACRCKRFLVIVAV